MVAALAIEQKLADGYRDEIEAFVAQAQIPDALRSLQDFARDFAPEFRQDTVHVSYNYNASKRRRSRGQKDDLDPIVVGILELTKKVHEAASVRPDYRPTPPRPKSEPPLVTGSEPISLAEHLRKRGAEAPHPQRDNNDAVADEEDQGSMSSLRRSFWRQLHKERPPDETIACTAEGLSKAYRGGRFRLEDVNFTLRAGEITGLVGRNASGKTTLLRLILGELAPDRGRLSYPMLAAKGAGWAAIKSQIAYVPQMPARWSGRLRENLNFVARIAGEDTHNVGKSVEWHLQRYGLEEYENHRWDQLSGGYRVRFELVKALVSKPRLLVLDEPLAYLDVIARQQFLIDLETIAASLERPVPIIVTSQHLYEIEAVADQMIILDGGTCTFAGPLETIGESVPCRMIEVTVRVSRKAIERALKPLGLLSIAATLEGYVLGFPKHVTYHAAMAELFRRFDDKLIAVRDITNSARSLFKEEASRPQ